MFRSLALLVSLVIANLGGSLQAQVDLKSDAVVYFGSASNTTAPASIDEDKVREATPEWQTIKAEGVRKGSARYKILMAEADKRIREAVRDVASTNSKDLVVRSGDVSDAKGKDVIDITNEVVEKLSQNPLAPPACVG
jgi:Skp family chaperone for outer membrane proteins